ncbi:MAG: autorepressor SdpR family transcription factor [Hyphomonas sp.]
MSIYEFRLQALSDPTRRHVLELLHAGPKSAGELAQAFDVSKPTMSAHFAVLREAGLVTTERAGKQVIYHLQMSVLEDALYTFAKTFGWELRDTGARPDDAAQMEARKS